MKIFELCVTMLVIWFPLEKHLVESISINMEESSGCGDFWERKYKKMIGGAMLGHQLETNIAGCIRACTERADCKAVQVNTITEGPGVGCILYSDYLRTEWSDTSNLYFRTEQCGGKQCHLVERRNSYLDAQNRITKYSENQAQGCYNGCVLKPQCIVAMYEILAKECNLYEGFGQYYTEEVNFQKHDWDSWIKICEDVSTEVYDPSQPIEHCSFKMQENFSTDKQYIGEFHLRADNRDQLIPLCKRGCLDNPDCAGFYEIDNLNICYWFSTVDAEVNPGYVRNKWNLECEIPVTNDGGSDSPDSADSADGDLDSNGTGSDSADKDSGSVSADSSDCDRGRQGSGSESSDSADSADGDGSRHKSGSESDDSDDGDGDRYRSGSESSDSNDGDGGRHRGGSDRTDSDESADGDGSRDCRCGDSADSADGDRGRHRGGSDSSDSDDGDHGRHRGGSDSSDSTDGDHAE